ncbi:thioesterase family protein [Nocardioides zeae]|uniref:Thioesterase family protein n=1 Tax=Nocardioides imazamoxiresistens TaxID=3231893 RepID=A0ABU3PZ92_9ACTN|nr:thioesterase family protein [Nocardioides zeae]MDT9594117.1 thioesterase family protein [Nocardioides zeae]
MTAYFRRTGATAYTATDHTRGAWSADDQHVAPSLGLLTHLVEADRDARRDDGLVLGRLSFDILGTMPVAELETTTRVVRPGRTIELVEATLVHAGRAVVVLRAWLLEPRDTAEHAGTHHASLPAPDTWEVWRPSSLWDGAFLGSVEVRRDLAAPGRGRAWARTTLPVVDDADTSPLTRAASVWDVANGMAVRADPARVAFPNLDLTAHLHRQPRGEWVGFDTTVSFGGDGLGLTSSVLHDADGPVGTSAQVLTVRPF